MCSTVRGGDGVTIAEVGRKYDMSTDTLRYYERIGLLPGVNRSKSGIRDFTDEDCRWVEFIKCMRGAGIGIDALIEYVALSRQGDSTAEARMDLLVEQRRQLVERLEEMRQTLARLDWKIEHYGKQLRHREGTVATAK